MPSLDAVAGGVSCAPRRLDARGAMLTFFALIVALMVTKPELIPFDFQRPVSYESGQAVRAASSLVFCDHCPSRSGWPPRGNQMSPSRGSSAARQTARLNPSASRPFGLSTPRAQKQTLPTANLWIIKAVPQTRSVRHTDVWPGHLSAHLVGLKVSTVAVALLPLQLLTVFKLAR